MKQKNGFTLKNLRREKGFLMGKRLFASKTRKEGPPSHGTQRAGTGNALGLRKRVPVLLEKRGEGRDTSPCEKRRPPCREQKAASSLGGGEEKGFRDPHVSSRT